jgi:hypothetical protein
MLNSVHTAKTLGPGVSTLSLSMDGAVVNHTSVVRHSDIFGFEEIEPHDSTQTMPNASIIPNMQFQMGVSENVEIGTFFVPQNLAFEASVKYRFYQNGIDHVAVIPTAAYFNLYNYAAGAHLVYTREISDALSLNFAAFGNYTYFDKRTFVDAFDLDSDADIQRNFINFGGYIAPRISGESVFFCPSIEYNTLLPLTEADFKNQQVFRFRITVGWYIGKVKQQLNRIESKIDKIDKKLDK